MKDTDTMYIFNKNNQIYLHYMMSAKRKKFSHMVQYINCSAVYIKFWTSLVRE